MMAQGLRGEGSRCTVLHLRVTFGIKQKAPEAGKATEGRQEDGSRICNPAQSAELRNRKIGVDFVWSRGFERE